jgi:hypothetical protein
MAHEVKSTYFREIRLPNQTQLALLLFARIETNQTALVFTVPRLSATCMNSRQRMIPILPSSSGGKPGWLPELRKTQAAMNACCSSFDATFIGTSKQSILACASKMAALAVLTADRLASC